VTEGLPFTPSGAAGTAGWPVSCVVQPGKNTIAIRRTEQMSIPYMRMIDVILLK
jgi:hypothetical protein